MTWRGVVFILGLGACAGSAPDGGSDEGTVETTDGSEIGTDSDPGTEGTDPSTEGPSSCDWLGPVTGSEAQSWWGPTDLPAQPAPLGASPPCVDSVTVWQAVPGDPVSAGLASCSDGRVHRVEPPTCQIPSASKTGCGTEGSACEPGCGEGLWCRPDPQFGECGCAPIPVSDEDCPASQVVECQDAASRCVVATCATDADCGDGLLCRRHERAGCGGVAVVTFQCESPDDVCRSDAECACTDLRDLICDPSVGHMACGPDLSAFEECP